MPERIAGPPGGGPGSAIIKRSKKFLLGTDAFIGALGLLGLVLRSAGRGVGRKGSPALRAEGQGSTKDSMVIFPCWAPILLSGPRVCWVLCFVRSEGGFRVNGSPAPPQEGRDPRNTPIEFFNFIGTDSFIGASGLPGLVLRSGEGVLSGKGIPGLPQEGRDPLKSE